MVLLIAEGPSFTFHLLAANKTEAKRIFRTAWAEHVKQTGAADDPQDAVTINYIAPCSVGQVYRDYEAL